MLIIILTRINFCGLLIFLEEVLPLLEFRVIDQQSNSKIKTTIKYKLKKMKINLFLKSVLSLFPFLITLFFLELFIFEQISFELYEKVWIFLFILMLLQAACLIYIVSKRKIKTEKKILLILLMISIVWFQLYYIWIIDDKII